MSVSTDGSVLWWDIRKLGEPVESLTLKERGSDTVLGAVSLEYSPTAGPTKFMIGTEQGQIISCNRKAKNPQDRVGATYPGAQIQQNFSIHRPLQGELWPNGQHREESTSNSVTTADHLQLYNPAEGDVDLGGGGGDNACRRLGIAILQQIKDTNVKIQGLRNTYCLSVGHHGPVYGLTRSPFFPKFFLSIGDWTARVWNEDLKTPIMTSKYHSAYLNGGRWSPTR